MHKITIILLSVIALCASEPSAFEAGNLDAPNPYGLTSSEKVILKNKKEVKTFEKNQVKRIEQLPNKIKKFEREIFGCKNDADRAFKKFQKSNDYFAFEYSYNEIFKSISGKKGRPATDDKILKGYSLKIVHTGSNEVKIKEEKNTKGRFILATNELDKNKISDNKILLEYKSQSKVENSFRFIKDPSFLISDIYLKKPERIEALMVIMALSLMIYNVGEYHLRKILEEANETVPNQVGKEIQNPTLKWIFQYFRGINVLNFDLNGTNNTIVTGLNSVHEKIISFFGEAAIEMYAFSEEKALTVFKLKEDRFLLSKT